MGMVKVPVGLGGKASIWERGSYDMALYLL